MRLTREEDSIILGTSNGMSIHFQADNQQLRPLGRATRGVKAMKLKKGDELISMDILTAQVTAGMADTEEDEEILDNENEELTEEETTAGPWILAITNGGYGKRVPISQFRLQKRAGMGVRAIKFKSDSDCLASLRVVNAEDELMIVSNRGIIIRQAVDAISMQSRAATGVRVQRLDSEDAIAAVALVPPAPETEGEEETEETVEE